MLHRQVLKYPLLDLLKSVMILVEYLLGSLQVVVHLGRLVPRQIKYRLDVCPADIGVRTHRIHLGELVYLLADLGIRLLRQSQLGQLVLPFSDLIIYVLVLAELLLDDLELLSQVVLPLPAVHVLDNAVVDPPGNGQDVVLLADDIYQMPYSQLD